MNNEMQTCNMDERTNEEKLSDMVDELIAERDKYKLALEQIIKLTQCDDTFTVSTAWNIANKALEDK